MSENNEEILIDGELVSLADLAGIDMTEVKEVRFSVTPPGKFHWRIMNMELTTKEVLENYDDPDAAKITIAVVNMELKAVNCLALVDDELDPADYVDITQLKVFKLQQSQKGLGRVKAFLSDIGIEGNKPFGALLDEAHGVEFVSDVSNSALKDNPDIVFANIDNVMTLEEFNESQG